MSADSEQQVSPSKVGAGADCPLSDREQTRNLLLYGTNISLIYLGAPVLYVGITQAALCEELGASKTIANLPSTLYFWMTPLPVLVAWYFCRLRLLKPVLITTYLILAAVNAFVAAALLLPTPDGVSGTIVRLNRWLPADFQAPTSWVIPAILLHGAVVGGSLGVVATYQWEMLGKCVSESRRGQALSLAFGGGPLLAALSSLGSQLVLTGKLGPLQIPKIEYPWSFATLFGSAAPLMILAAFSSSKFIVPPSSREVIRLPFVQGVFGGFGEFISYRTLLLASLAFILVGSGYNILPNIALYTREAVGQAAQEYTGYQNALRFGFKAPAGLFLGWLLAKSNPKAGLLVTAGFCLLSVVWALLAPQWFLLSFLFMGIGELFGVYYPNYILCCSAKSKMRRNMSFSSMLNFFSGFAAVFYGLIADRFGLPTSFVIAVVFLVAVLLLVQLALPARPRPREGEGDGSDQTPEPAGKEAIASTTA